MSKNLSEGEMGGFLDDIVSDIVRDIVSNRRGDVSHRKVSKGVVG